MNTKKLRQHIGMVFQSFNLFSHLTIVENVSNRVFYMDEGIIYEEGSPKGIFKNPKKDKTRLFIHNLKEINLTIKNSDKDIAVLSRTHSMTTH